MKRNGCFFLCVAIFCCVFSGCGSHPDAAADADADTTTKQLRIVTTIFPEYDWVRQILGEKADEAEITLLQGSGVDLHSYQPTVDDMVKISACDLFVYVGGESDQWAADALAETANERRMVVKLLDVLEHHVKTEEQVEGMRDGGDGEEYDEHVSLGYDGRELLGELSFAVNEGDYLCIVGENGAGKSTLMRTILGLQAPLGGSVRFGDALAVNEISYLPQQTAVQRDFPASVWEIVLSGCQGRIAKRPYGGALPTD